MSTLIPQTKEQKMNIKLLSGYVVLLALVLSFTFCHAQQINVVKVDTSKGISASEGIYYSLPRTQFEIEVHATKIEKIKGPYADFASKYLGLSNVINVNSISYELGDISIRTTSIPDPDQYYFVELNGKSGKGVNEIMLSLSESGIIQNTTGMEPDEKEVSTFSVQTEESNVYPEIFKYFSDLNLLEQVDTIIERVNVDTTTIEKMILRRTLVEKTPEQKAKDAADFIIKVKENRFNLISGFQEVNYDKETFTLMNEELEKLESEYQKLFTGLTFNKTLSYTFKYIPDELQSSDSVALFKFSRLRGVLDISNPNGDMIFLKISRNDDTYAIANCLKRKTPPKDGQHGFYYRIPEYANVSILLGNKLRSTGKFLVSQFGVISWLPPYKAGVQFYPATGAIKRIEIKN
jgi:hypothetical protein